MFEKFTNRAKQIIKLSKKEAQIMRHNYLGTEHIFLALLKLGQGVAINVLKNWDVNYKAIKEQLEKELGLGQEIQVYEDPALTSKVKDFFDKANEEAEKLNHNYVGIEHLLLALLNDPKDIVYKVLEKLQIDIKELRKEILKELETFNLQLPSIGFSQSMASQNFLGFNEDGKIGGEKTSPINEKTPSLDMYGRDLTQMFREGKLDPVIGREKEIERLILILCRRRKNNPVLVGEAGVGKTAIVEGLASAIVKGSVPEDLSKKKLIALDLALMVAGTKYRGQFEERIKSVMEEVTRHGNILLFIDELHTIVGAGAAEGAIDASNIFKPVLSRGELQCIGATTVDEYRKYIEKDAALARRFQKITVPAPSIEEAMFILNGIKKKYEEHHRCTYTDAAIKAAVTLSDRYVWGDRFLPDKAIDVMDETGSKMRIGILDQPEDIKNLAIKLASTSEAKESAIDQQEYEKAAKLRDEEKKLKNQLDNLNKQWEKNQKEHKVVIDEDDIATVIASQTGVPIGQLTEGERSKIVKLEVALKQELIGQQEAISTVSRAIRRTYADVKDPNRPMGCFLFLGPTGVGKTLCARLLAQHIFGGKDALIQIDMSEYMEKFAVSRMTGSPPGYVGHEEGGQLTEKVRQRPYSVILFDEIEKAHPDVIDILLQISEEGRLTDSYGRKIDFRHSIIIITSNLGADLISKSTQMGFGASEENLFDYERISETIHETIKKTKIFKPEFLNRLDDMVIFSTLSKENLMNIVDLEINKLQQRLKKNDININISNEIKKYLVEEGFKPEMGARPLRRTIQKHLEDELAEKILLNKKGKYNYDVILENNKLQFREISEDKREEKILI